MLFVKSVGNGVGAAMVPCGCAPTGVWPVLPRPNTAANQFSNVVQLLDHARLIVMLLDESGIILYVNDHGCRLAGMSEGELVQHAFTDAMIEEGSSKRIGDSLMKLLRGQQTHFNHESVLEREDGDSLVIDWHHTRLKGSDDESAVLCIGVDVTLRRKAEKNLAWLADHDPLTKIYNRRRLEADLEKILHRAGRYGHGGAVLYFDIDEFKLINDTGGHSAGDDLLCTIAGRLRQSQRATDLPARMGGDEFAIILDETDEEGAKQAAERLVQNLSSITIRLGDLSHHVSISLGMVLYPQHGQTVEELLTHADMAMYHAKRLKHPGGRWHCFEKNDTGQEMMRRKVNWRARIEHALANQKFTLFYQPVVVTGNGTIHHYEALLRMTGDDGEMILPGEFIDVAETCGLISQIDFRVVQLACHELGRWRRQNRSVTLGINLSAQTLDVPGFVPFVTTQIERYQLNPAQLNFEITERSAVANMEPAQRMMREMQKLGCTFALDDFGIGFSSWLYLKQLPLNYLKLDSSLTRLLVDQQEDRAFVKAINEMSHALGLRTIAEAVENAATLEILQSFDVDMVQGYYLGKPAPHLINEVTAPRSA
ncbi:MAG: EAL domain-containing protein [Burkholderiaceae bacterium]|nr:MAG: EAL domain-containing protein [Burkholderiaceae bacterium]